MKHAAHKAPKGASRTMTKAVSRARRGASHSVAAVIEAQKAEHNGAVVALDAAVASKLNEIAPMSRRAMREAARANERRNVLIGSASLAALVGAAATTMSFANPKAAPALAGETTMTSQITPVADTDSAAASRGEARPALDGTQNVDADENGVDHVQGEEATSAVATQSTTNSGSWGLSDAESNLDAAQLTKALAANPNVAKLVDQDQGLLPAGFDPNHATGDSGCAYEFSQCTWWAYTRRHQLGLPVGSYLGNGGQWASSARALGYWVDNTPRHVGDIIVFQPGQEGSSAVYGHVAIVEAINPDGSITTSECGASYHGKTFSRTFTNVHDFQYIHY
ncbi:CHAP domain-containing protein [Bifidobacterium pullorum subsp. saeculare]|uniref:CHAP domain-containing protein n=1 Tax=Bifidobacterium pullorum subsp. saeculare TaxID=78257 RepID=A0A938WXN2_9BIFI|nr:CHAP domain-containing protein [Bifidobacterium pullorum]MBM6699796.1 CHAP domain-containing protein [Bifidobacterium pullorum subsp. saeculare]